MPDPSVVVAVLTFRRPDDLRELLPVLADQVGRVEAPGGGCEVLVVDNDPEGGGRATVAELGLAGVRYVHEPRPGIAAARNRALAEAGAHDVLVFIDDDERPGDDWLRRMLDSFARTRAEGVVAVVGAVISVFPGPLDPWVEEGRFFDRRRLPTGTRVTVAATNNLLIDMVWLRAQGITFDERFGLSGGSDTLFSRQLIAAGGRMVWDDEAVVTDVVPVHRATRGWVLRRQVRSGNSWSRTALVASLTRRDRVVARVGCLSQGLARLAGGTVRLALGALLRDRARRITGIKNLARGGGMVAGALGYTYVEYRR